MLTQQGEIDIMDENIKSLLIDHRNIDLWNDINNTMNISVTISDDEIVSSVFCYRNNANIIISNRSTSKVESFTHELLHVYMAKLQIDFGPDLKLSVNKYPHLCKFMTDTLIDDINNCLEHIKIFPLYLNLGYERDRFIADYYHGMISLIDKIDLRLHLRKTYFFNKRINYNIINTQLFIRKYLSLKVCFDPNKDYSKNLKMFYKIDPVLCGLLNLLLIEWENYNINIPNNDYCHIKDNFIYRLNQWASDKEFY